MVEEKLKGKSSFKAAVDAGYSKNTAKNANGDILEKPGTQSIIASLRSEFKKLGFDEKLVATRLHDSMFAEKLNNKGDSYTDWAAIHRAIDKWGAFNDLSTERKDTNVTVKGLEDVLGSVVKTKPNADKPEAE